MKGHIRSYLSAEESGLIKCVNGKEFRFLLMDWLDTKPPHASQCVIFRQNGKSAVDITEE
jgi:hypothetical protein